MNKTQKTSKYVIITLTILCVVAVLAALHGYGFITTSNSIAPNFHFELEPSLNLITGLINAAIVFIVIFGLGIYSLDSKEMTLKEKFLSFINDIGVSDRDVWLGGVCGGLGTYTNIPSWVYRVIFLIFILTLNCGLIEYIALWIFLPKYKLREY
ncbi:MAG: PspC domain-containing protein [Lentisphaeraceae bacterium]|nr:PspC domain-containing protein [Lentisphaeraceae bacterium]